MGDPGPWLLRLSSHASPLAIFAAASLGFAAIYFALGGLCALLTAKVLPRLGWGRAIDERPLRPGQVRGEVLRSLVSIAIFGAYGVLTLWLDAKGLLHLRWTLEWRGLLADLVVMTAWNELHFYACHRLLHTRRHENLWEVVPEPPLRPLCPIFREGVHRVVTDPARVDVQLLVGRFAKGLLELGMERRIDATQ